MMTHVSHLELRRLVMFLGLVFLTFQPFSAHGQSCHLSDTSKIVEGSHKILHDFEKDASNCDSDFGPSGIVYHPGIDRLVVISDKGGEFATMKTDGSDVECRKIRDPSGNPLEDADHEAVTFADPGDGFIYVGVESGPENGIAIIRQVDLATATVKDTWRIGFPGGIERNDGLESITFVPDETHAEGGTFYVGDQTAEKVIGRCELPIRSGGRPDILFGCSVEINPKWKEVSGLDYVADAEFEDHRGVLFLSSDSNDKLAAFTPDGQRLDWTIDLPDSSEPGQEGHAIRGCELYISSDANDDSRKIHRYQFTP